MCKSENSTGETYIDLLPSKISPSEFITLLLEKSEIPSFIRDKGTNQD